ncbi:MAG: S1C family serine protease [Planctomycetota bacterium]|jgi:hypothetical protein
MKAGNTIFVFLAILFIAGTTLNAESESTDGPPSLGIMLDLSGLPPLLTKHLGLSADQGVRVRNVHREGPADKAGLERDDIIIGFQGEEVTEAKEFARAVRQARIGTEVSLEIIHLGRRKTVNLRLEPFPREPDWKYPPEPEIVQSWRPGKMFRLRPGDKDWMEIPFDKFPDIDLNIERFFKELYCFHHNEGGESYTVTIEGSPEDENTTITVKIDNGEGKTVEYKTTVGDIDQLPKKYRDVVKEDLDKARESCRNKCFRHFSPPYAPWPKIREYFHDKDYFPFGSDEPWYRPGNPIYDRIEKEMHQLRERIEELEKSSKESLERLSDKLKEKKSQYEEKWGRQKKDQFEEL